MADDRNLNDEINRLRRVVDSEGIGEARRAYVELGSSVDDLNCRETGFCLRLLEARIAAEDGQYRKALAIGEALLASCRDSGDKIWVGLGHLLLSRILERLGEHSEAEKHCEAVVHYCRWEVEDKKIEGDAWNNLGVIHKNVGLWDEAERDLRRALEAYAALGDAGLNLRASLNLAVLLRKMGKLEDAWNICREGLYLAAELRDAGRECRFCLEAGNIAVIRRDAAEASSLVGRARSIAERNGYRRESVLACEIAGDVAGLRGDSGAALSLYSKGLGLAREFARGCDLECEFLRRMCGAHLSMGRLEEAKLIVEEALELAEKLKDEYEYAVCLRFLGQIEIGEGLQARGSDHLAESIEQLNKLSPWCHEVGVGELALGKAQIGRWSGVNDAAGLEHMLAARRVYANLGIGSVVREIDQTISTLMGFAQEYHDSRVGGPVSRSTRRIGPEQYGIMTTDERIVGDLERWGASGMRILIEGETGVGKELVARAIHAMGGRREEAFSIVDCGGLSESLAESELFGHVRGSFRGAVRDRIGLIEAGHGGTLFLDEVGELNEVLQVKLLRVLEEGAIRRVGESHSRPVDVRLLSATTKDLWAEVEAGRFRRDLYYRLHGVVMRIPALRERPDDIDLLSDHFLGVYCSRYGKSVLLTESARAVLRRYGWPGNVRELKSVMEALVVASYGNDRIDEPAVRRFLTAAGGGKQGTLHDLERREIDRALKSCKGNKTLAARMLGISRKTLANRLNHHT